MTFVACRGDDSEVAIAAESFGIADAHIRLAEIGVLARLMALRPELDLESLRQAELLEEREIQGLGGGPVMICRPTSPPVAIPAA